MPFEVLRTTVIPALAEARGGTRRLRILSAVCASGQEPYSIGLMLAKDFPQLADWSLEIVALDPSQELVEQAGTGAYDQIVVQRGLPAMLLIKFFERAGHQWRVKDPPRSWVNFHCHDITTTPYEGGPFDVVLLANVLGQLDIDSHPTILDRLAGTLAPDGYFFVGSTEGELVTTPQFERIEDSRAPYFRLRS